MVSLTTVIALLLALPCLLSVAAGESSSNDQCPLVSVSVQLITSGRYNAYEATIRNAGSSVVSNIVLSTTANLREVDGLNESGNGEYTLSGANTLTPGASYSFTYNVKKQTTVNWSVTCAPKTTRSVETTQVPTAAAYTATTSGKTCSSGWWRPAPATTWQWQLTGTVDTTLDVQMYDIDLFDSTSTLISKLHSAGRTVICYFSTQYENWRPDASKFTSSVLGNNLDDWAGEKYVDIRSSVVRDIMAARMDLAVSKGCDGIEPDNVDGYQASTGFPIKAADQLDYNQFLANQAHARGLSVGLKNDGDQAAALQPYFDWALNEQCNQYSECSAFNTFISAGKAVFNCEYSGSPSSVCPRMVTAKFSTLFKKLALGASVTANCCTYAPGGCAKVAPKCVTSASARSVDVEEDIPLNELSFNEEDPSLNADETTAQEAKMSSASTTYASLFTFAGFTALVLL